MKTLECVRQASLEEVQDFVRGDGDFNDALEHWIKRTLEGCNQTRADEDLLDILKNALAFHSTNSIEDEAV